MPVRGEGSAGRGLPPALPPPRRLPRQHGILKKGALDVKGARDVRPACAPVDTVRSRTVCPRRDRARWS